MVGAEAMAIASTENSDLSFRDIGDAPGNFGQRREASM
jgi:hypothetical protein